MGALGDKAVCEEFPYVTVNVAACFVLMVTVSLSHMCIRVSEVRGPS